MTNTERIKALRWCPSRGCEKCVFNARGNCAGHGMVGLMNSAADALEVAEQRIAELEAQIPKEGKWIDENRRTRSSKFVCSTCKRTCYDIQPTRDKAWTKRCRYNYCPNCGAKMDGADGERRSDEDQHIYD